VRGREIPFVPVVQELQDDASLLGRQVGYRRVQSALVVTP
jgi:hypothetical protein